MKESANVKDTNQSNSQIVIANIERPNESALRTNETLMTTKVGKESSIVQLRNTPGEKMPIQSVQQLQQTKQMSQQIKHNLDSQSDK